MLYTVAALYRFTPIANPGHLRQTLKNAFAELELYGSLLIAPEGINGTLAGPAGAIDRMLEILAIHTQLPREDVKFSTAEKKPFNRLKIRLKREIITFKQPNADPARLAGAYVTAQEWNELIADSEVTLLDTRNSYETMIGTFAGARDPAIENFTDFAAYVRQNLDPKKHKKIAMFCTGGIRCEKASAFMRAEGFEEVYHLKGGILKYLEEVPLEASKWQGECYVFDRRVSVGHGLKEGNYSMCFGCGYALTENDRRHPHFEAGVSCPHCHDKTSQAAKARFRMRQGQKLQKIEA
ncbi:MAG: rhodanese-related sulfurtransferase [Dongiaceae bacterium]